MSAATPAGKPQGSSSPHRSLVSRIATGIEDCRSLLRTVEAPERVQEELHSPPARATGLDAATGNLERMIEFMLEWLQAPGEESQSVGVLRAKEILAELHMLWHEAAKEQLAIQGTRLRGVSEALQRLRGSDSMAQMVNRAPEYMCSSCGFDRCLVFRVEDSTFWLESLHFASQPEWQAQFAGYARAHPAVSSARDREIELLRRRVPILVQNPAGAQGMQDLLAGAWRSSAYVAAPVIVRGSVIGALHADRYFSGGLVDAFARDLLAAFAAGFGYALERAVLLDRTRLELRRLQQTFAASETSMRTAISDSVSLSGADAGPAMPAELSATVGADARLGALLTPRELEVVELMARGASNSDIATDLVISEGTVKSHVKHILRKLRAANRAQAVSTYMRLLSP